MSQERRALDATAISVMLLLTALWGFNQVTIKWIAADVSLVAQAAIRSIVATVLLLAWASFRRSNPVQPRRHSRLPASPRACCSPSSSCSSTAASRHTNASRMSVFVYLAPPLTALGLHFVVAGERLGARQWLGVALAFAGLVLAFAEGFSVGRTHLARRPVRPHRGDPVGGDHGADPRHAAWRGSAPRRRCSISWRCPPRFCPLASWAMGEKGRHRGQRPACSRSALPIKP